MTKIVSIAGAFAIALIATPAAAQPPPSPKPPLPDEIRPAIVEIAPPAMRVERARVARPGPAHVWTGGYWDWDGDSWAWVEGRWAVAPVRGATWVPARYVRVDGGWRYVPAHWSSQRVVGVSGKGKGQVKGKRKGHAKDD